MFLSITSVSIRHFDDSIHHFGGSFHRFEDSTRRPCSSFRHFNGSSRLRHKKPPAHCRAGGLKVYYYIFSGADTPIKRNALAIVVRTAVIRAKRASVSSLFEASNTFSAL
jgi:hypothetical protein